MGIIVDYRKITEFCTQVFEFYGVSRENAQTIADNLVQAELRGVKSHGLVQVKNYVNWLESGRIKAKPEIKILKETATTLVIDGDHGPGSVSGKYAMAKTIEKAKAFGIASTTVTGGTHFGMAAYYAMAALKENLIGIALCNAGAKVAVHGGYSPALGTNPICVAVPTASRLPIVYDGATSEAAFNKIFFALTEDKKIPHGWALDENGKSTDEPSEAVKGSLVTFGSYKGSGLSILVHIFSGLLSGAAIKKAENGLVSEDLEAVGFYFSVIDIEKFLPVEDFKQAVDLMIDRLKASKPINKAIPIYMPGELEFIRKENSIKNGIEILYGVQKNLREIEVKLGMQYKLEDCIF
jgi:LDH2 family malate/lactate/ureidoglycolate dehydrogenase